jgi:hypothetical protein
MTEQQWLKSIKDSITLANAGWLYSYTECLKYLQEPDVLIKLNFKQIAKPSHLSKHDVYCFEVSYMKHKNLYFITDQTIVSDVPLESFDRQAWVDMKKTYLRSRIIELLIELSEEMLGEKS